MAYASSMAAHVQSILQGSSDPDPSQHGLTSEDERARCNMGQVRRTECWAAATTCRHVSRRARVQQLQPEHLLELTDWKRTSSALANPRISRAPRHTHTHTQWPGVSDAVRPPNAGLRLFGGAAFERCLNEFQEAANALRFPTGALQHRPPGAARML